MMCIRCGLQKSGADQFFVCDDCQEFGPLVKSVYSQAHETFDREDDLDPTDKDKEILRLLADTSFLNTNNPQTAIYYSLSMFFLQRASAGHTNITESELNRAVSTIRSWTDAFQVFEKLGLVKVTTSKFERNIKLTPKMVKLADQFGLDGGRSQEVVIRRAHTYAGYALMFILNELAKVDSVEERNSLPYGKSPRTLWTSLMFLWGAANSGSKKFTEDDFARFLSARRIPSRARGNIFSRLQAFDGRSTQTLIKDVEVSGNQRVFQLEDYVLREMNRIRERTRSRER
ncbi:MAG: hypothetical protein MUO81_07710 [Thermoplasmata archaeon]|nr:hypothetical protein [Thermoplasmata archaeon]